MQQHTGPADDQVTSADDSLFISLHRLRYSTAEPALTSGQHTAVCYISTATKVWACGALTDRNVDNSWRDNTWFTSYSCSRKNNSIHFQRAGNWTTLWCYWRNPLHIFLMQRRTLSNKCTDCSNTVGQAPPISHWNFWWLVLIHQFKSNWAHE